MKKKWIIVLAFVLTLLFSSGVAMAALQDPDYLAGYVAAQEFYAGSSIEYEADFAFYVYLNQGNIDQEILRDYARRIKYQEGFTQGYTDAMEGAPPDVNFAEAMGRSLGELYAADDYYAGLISSYSRAMPSDSAIIFRYNLGKLQVTYREDFIAQFKLSFQEGYIDKYEQLLLGPKLDSFQRGLSDGMIIGDSVGRIFAQRDYENKLTMNYLRNLKTDDQIKAQYRLTIHEMSTPEYVDAFIQGYKMSYQLGYADEYRTRANDDYSGMMEFFIISPAG